MASWDPGKRASRRDTWLAAGAIILVLACLLIVGAIEGSSLNPDTDCRWDEVRTVDGTCR